MKNSYEFQKKEVRESFKKTELGSKLNKKLYISICVCIISLIVLILDLYIIKNDIILIFIPTIFAVSLVIMCYYDGKRDGAITQFSIDKDKKNT